RRRTRVGSGAGDRVRQPRRRPTILVAFESEQSARRRDRLGRREPNADERPLSADAGARASERPARDRRAHQLDVSVDLLVIRRSTEMSLYARVKSSRKMMTGYGIWLARVFQS